MRTGVGDSSSELSGVGDVALLGAAGEDQVALVHTRAGAVFVPDNMRRRMTAKQLGLGQRIQQLAMQREAALRAIDDLAVKMRDSGASWAQIGWFANLSETGARKRWGGEDG